jgi:hypothetical protein
MGKGNFESSVVPPVDEQFGLALDDFDGGIRSLSLFSHPPSNIRGMPLKPRSASQAPIKMYLFVKTTLTKPIPTITRAWFFIRNTAFHSYES